MVLSTTHSLAFGHSGRHTEQKFTTHSLITQPISVAPDPSARQMSRCASVHSTFGPFDVSRKSQKSIAKKRALDLRRLAFPRPKRAKG